VKRLILALVFMAVLPLAAKAQEDAVKIPLAEMADGQAHFHKLDVSGVDVRYFLVKAPDGTIRAALDACEVCAPEKKGFKQDGQSMICNNCGRQYPMSRIGLMRGGCNPHPLKATVQGDQVLLDRAELADGVKFFK
jgi:uncharacterized membrane protein